MILGNLYHLTIKAKDLDVTGAFYTDVMGMELAPRPALDFPGLWLRSPMLGVDPIIHIYGGDAAKGLDGKVPLGTGSIDHVAITACGFLEFRERLARFGLPWWEQEVPDTPIWQIFVFDPSGVLLEVSFNGPSESIQSLVIPAERQYRPGVPKFDPDAFGKLNRRPAVAKVA